MWATACLVGKETDVCRWRLNLGLNARRVGRRAAEKDNGGKKTVKTAQICHKP